MDTIKPRKFGFSADALKLMAIVAMTIDHIGWAFVETSSPAGVLLHFFGRITGITMFFFLVEGYHLTRNVYKYILRLAVFAVVSYPAFIFYKFGTLPNTEHWHPFGVLYTLLLGFLMLHARHTIQSMPAKVAVIFVLIALSVWGDWAIYGPLFILVFDIFRGSFKKQALAASLLIVYSILEGVAAQSVPYILIQLGQFLPLGLLCCYNGKKGRLGWAGKWLFYTYYPFHLVVIGLVSLWTKS